MVVSREFISINMVIYIEGHTIKILLSKNHHMSLAQ